LERVGLYKWELYYLDKENGYQSIGAGVNHHLFNKTTTVNPGRTSINKTKKIFVSQLILDCTTLSSTNYHSKSWRHNHQQNQFDFLANKKQHPLPTAHKHAKLLETIVHHIQQSTDTIFSTKLKLRLASLEAGVWMP